MGRKAKYSKELKLEIVKRYLKGESASALANEYGMPYSTRNKIVLWSKHYEINGEESLETLSYNKTYPKELKEKIIFKRHYVKSIMPFYKIKKHFVLIYKMSNLSHWGA